MRFVAFVAALILIATLLGCAADPTATPIIIVVTATPEPATAKPIIPPTNTLQPAPATDTPLPPPTPTSIPVLSIQDTATMSSWLLSVGKIEARDQLRDVDGHVFTPRGRFWLVWLDAKNVSTGESSLENSLSFTLHSDRYYHHADRIDDLQVDMITKAESRDALNANVASNSLTHALLIFDMESYPLPDQLYIQQRSSQDVQIAFNVAAIGQAQATALSVAAVTGTAVAIAQVTSEAAQTATAITQRASDANATATAVQKQANATTTAVQKQANATATAIRKAYEGYRVNPPKGEFTGISSRVGIRCSLKYQKCIEDWCANNVSKFIVISVVVVSGHDGLSVNPLYFTLISTDGYAVNVDSRTYSMNNYLDAIDLQPDTYTSGYIAFLTNTDFIPSQLVWQDFEGTVVVKIIDPEP